MAGDSRWRSTRRRRVPWRDRAGDPVRQRGGRSL